MGLVEYSDSESEKEDPHEAGEVPPAKKRKVSTSAVESLPPLPSSFLDQYSSTVRTSTKDDPELHGGRKRVAPHVEGHWPTHVYLEWHPSPQECSLLAEIVSATQPSNSRAKARVTSLLDTDLNVAQPLHISLSRPLTLKTDQKDGFLAQLKYAIAEGNVKAFDVDAKELAWHPNETKTRCFLVLRLQASSSLSKLLDLCNGTAKAFGQPLLYESSPGDHFHISIAWSLESPRSQDGDHGVEASADVASIPYALLGQLDSLAVHFDEVKIRIGQDVHNIALKAARRQSSG